eukprot:419608-Rhodomonas_salina.1
MSRPGLGVHLLGTISGIAPAFRVSPVMIQVPLPALDHRRRAVEKMNLRSAAQKQEEIERRPCGVHTKSGVRAGTLILPHLEARPSH